MCGFVDDITEGVGKLLGDFEPLAKILGTVIPGPWTPFVLGYNTVDSLNKGDFLGSIGGFDPKENPLGFLGAASGMGDMFNGAGGEGASSLFNTGDELWDSAYGGAVDIAKMGGDVGSFLSDNFGQYDTSMVSDYVDNSNWFEAQNFLDNTEGIASQGTGGLEDLGLSQLGNIGMPTSGQSQNLGDQYFNPSDSMGTPSNGAMPTEQSTNFTNSLQSPQDYNYIDSSTYIEGDPAIDKLTQGKGMDLKDLFKYGKLAGSIYDFQQNRRSGDELMKMADVFGPQRDASTRRWNQAYDNPESLYKEYMAGAGQDYMKNAAATYAKAGRRHMLPQLQSQAHQNFYSNYLPQYRAGTNPSQFSGPNPYMSTAGMNMKRNSVAPIAQGLGDLFQSNGWI